MDGIWTYVLSPVFNDQGEVVAAMEVGTNLYAFQESNTAMLREMVFSIVSIIAIIILLFTEVTFLWYHRAARQKAIDEAADPDRKRRELAVYLIRPMIFVIFAADCMATAFLPMMASELAVPVGGISQEMMSAIPISTEVFVTAVFSFLGGFLVEKYGFRPVLVAGSICVGERAHTVHVGENEVQLTLKEYQLLCLLMKNRGAVLTRDVLLENIWGYGNESETRTVDVHIRTLRQKLGPGGSMIETVRGVGYRMGDHE